MLQNLRSYRSLRAVVDPGGTRLPDTPCRLVVIRNTSLSETALIHGMSSGEFDTHGISLPPNETFPTLWMDNLNQIGFRTEGTDNFFVEILYGV